MSEQLRTRESSRDARAGTGLIPAGRRTDRSADVPALVVGALLALAIGVVHVYDQHGFPGDIDLGYLKYGYYAIEVVSVLTALLLFAGRRTIGWFLAVGVGAGPLIGYLLSRGPGLPNDADDIGNWTQPDGLISLSLEAVLIVLAGLSFLLSRRGDASR